MNAEPYINDHFFLTIYEHLFEETIYHRISMEPSIKPSMETDLFRTTVIKKGRIDIERGFRFS